MKTVIVWHKFSDDKPPENNWAYFISGHEFFGIGYWSNGEWRTGFIGEFPGGEEGSICSADILNDEVLFWSQIPNYPV